MEFNIGQIANVVGIPSTPISRILQVTTVRAGGKLIEIVRATQRGRIRDGRGKTRQEIYFIFTNFKMAQ
jgi:hypothetical protein